ncbi:MAG TPA: endonuclease/exonuclease/phosphatase family protein [Gemmatimonadaceae bacterium]|nr:endonuclease/exonuclease/phosphatase family protein [Gemmatimonadaceae bacterium]
MRWIDAVAPKDAERNDRWRRGVGPPLVCDYTRGRLAPIDRLPIVTWNIHVGSADIFAFIADLRAGQFTDGERITDFVLLVQETFRSGHGVPAPMPADAISPQSLHHADSRGARFDVEEIAERSQFFAAYVPSMRNGSGANARTGECEDRGNAIFSTVPIHDITAIELPLQHQRRVAVFGTLRCETSDGGEVGLELGSVHLDLRTHPGGRAAQARAIIDACTAPACVIGGDLNVFPWIERTHELLSRAFPHARAHDQLPTHVSPLIRRRIDHLFCRVHDHWHTLPYRRIHDRYGSDHYPLIGGVNFYKAQ